METKKLPHLLNALPSQAQKLRQTSWILGVADLFDCWKCVSCHRSVWSRGHTHAVCICVSASGFALHCVAVALFDELAVLTLIRASLLARLQQTWCAQTGPRCILDGLVGLRRALERFNIDGTSPALDSSHGGERETAPCRELAASMGRKTLRVYLVRYESHHVKNVHNCLLTLPQWRTFKQLSVVADSKFCKIRVNSLGKKKKKRCPKEPQASRYIRAKSDITYKFWSYD